MRLWIRVLLTLFASGNFLAAFGQDTTTRSGFAIVTVVSGNIAGLVATETLRNATSSGVDQVIVAPSGLITAASMLVPVGPRLENTTGIAITNPSLSSGGVNMILTDVGGSVVSNATIVLGAHGHFAQFLNELFVPQPAGFSTPVLLTVSSEIPIAILAVNFRAGDFAFIPLSSLSSPIPVPVQPSSTTLAATFSTPVTVVTSPVPTTTSIGGSGSLVFAQIVVGGGWSTEIAVGNTSAGIQQIQIDFFGPDGSHMSTLPDIVIPSRGVFLISIGT